MLANIDINIIKRRYNIPIIVIFLVIKLNIRKIVIHIPPYFNPSMYPFWLVVLPIL